MVIGILLIYGLIGLLIWMSSQDSWSFSLSDILLYVIFWPLIMLFTVIDPPGDSF